MFDFLRNLTKSDEEKRQERLSAYLDDNLTPQERLAFEAELEADSALQASLAQQRLIKQNLNALPPQRAHRNFTLDPALYGRPTSPTLFRLYPVMRTATVLAAIVLVFLFSLEFFTPATQESGDTLAQAPLAASETSNNEISGESAAQDPAAAAIPEQFDIGEADAETAVEEMAEEAMEEEFVEEAEVMEEAVVEEEMESAVSVEAEVAEEDVGSEEAAPPSEPEIMEETAADLGGGEAEVPRTTTESEGVTEVEEDGSLTTISPPLTPTQRLTQTTTLEAYPDTNDQSSDTQPGQGEEESSFGLDSITPIRRPLQIGLGLLFLVLLAGTWFLRRQL